MDLPLPIKGRKRVGIGTPLEKNLSVGPKPGSGLGIAARHGAIRRRAVAEASQARVRMVDLNGREAPYPGARPWHLVLSVWQGHAWGSCLSDGSGPGDIIGTMPKRPGKKKNPAAVALGRLGGKKGGPATAAKLSPKERSESARRAALARWGKKNQAP
jgi:hypothetical protein